MQRYVLASHWAPFIQNSEFKINVNIRMGEVVSLSAIPDELFKAYRSTHYRVLEPSDFVFRIGEYSESLALLYKEEDVSSAAFLTAWNPFSRTTEQRLNDKADQKLRDMLQADNIRFLNGMGEDPEGLWSAERSVLALGISLETAIAIGEMYYQNAIVWIAADAVPQLKVLR